jgi:(E)-4-hydroxy-3-methylbut-2-enyl-diphosphate synthase
LKKIKKCVGVGRVMIGGGHAVCIQSMTNTDTADIEATCRQMTALQEAGCEIVRASVYNQACARAFKQIKQRIRMPLVADVHFDHRLAIAAVENGADKLRINPGNIGGQDRVCALAQCCKSHGVPIRIGVNAGSLQKELLAQYGVSAEAMVRSALQHISQLEREGFDDIVVSLKASSVSLTVEAYRRLHVLVDYPLHLGVTEAGTERMALIKSAAGIGALLLDGIGDTFRVSITGDPVKEVKAGLDILRALRLREGLDIISCPTCGRCAMDVEGIVEELERRLEGKTCALRIAVMGCAVNGPGEAKEADVGIACTHTGGLLFKKGVAIRNVAKEDMVDALLGEIEAF